MSDDYFRSRPELFGPAYMGGIKRMLATVIAMSALKPDEARKIIESLDDEKWSSELFEPSIQNELSDEDREIVRKIFHKAITDISEKAREQLQTFDVLLSRRD